MKIFRYFIAAVLVFGVLGVTGVANAFTFGGLDPSTGLTYIDPGVPFAVDFGTCPTDVDWDGCFSGYNESNVTITTIEVVFPNIGPIANQGVNCDVSDSSSLFSVVDFCGLSADQTEYIIELSQGTGTGIPPGPGNQANFMFVEDGVDCSSPTVACTFPAGTAVANPTPEPSSLLLALSGLGPLGYLVRRRRKNQTL